MSRISEENSPDDVLARCAAKLDGAEPEEWPVPIAKSDLRVLLDLARGDVAGEVRAAVARVFGESGLNVRFDP